MADEVQDFDSIVSSMLTDAASYIDEEVSTDRAKAMRFYRGDKYGDEEEGRSQVVSRDVHDVIQSVLPSIIRTFMGAEKVVEYAPQMPEDIDAAEQATDYACFILNQDNDWEKEFRSLAFDALLFGDGFGAVSIEELETVKAYTFSNLDEDALMALMQEEAVELDVGQNLDGTYDAYMKRKTKEQRFRVMALPPEQFIVDRRATCFGDAEIVGMRIESTINDLVEMGYDREEMEQHASDNNLNTNAEVIERQPYNRITNGESQSMGYRKVQYVEAYTKFDLDGDGIAELIKVCCVGTGFTVIKSEPVDCVPFFKLSMSPNAHSFFSEGMYDRLYDVQRINSQVMRLTLDSLAQSIFPRTVVIEGEVEINDVLNNEIGAVIRARSAGAVTPMVTPFAGQAAFPVLDYMRQVKEQRTNISGASMGVSADVLTNATREAVNASIQSGQGQIEMICRNFAMGLKDMFRILLRHMVAHQDAPRMIRLRNDFVSVDPRPWNACMDVEINVGLSAGTIEQRLSSLQYIFETQLNSYRELGAGNGIVSLGQIRATAAKIAQLSGWKDTSQFYTAIPLDYDVEPQEGVDDPNAQATQALAEAERLKAELSFESSKMKAEVDLMTKREKMESDERSTMLKLQMEANKLEMQRERMILDLEVQRAKLLQEMAKEERAAIKDIVQMDKDAQNDALAKTEQSAMALAVTQLGEMIASLQGGQGAIASAMSAPKQVVRDEAGRIVGVQSLDGSN